MTVRITVSLPDDVHAGLTRIAEGSHISASAVVRSILSDALPRMTSVLDFLGAVKPEEAPGVLSEMDAWTKSLRDLMHAAPESLGPIRTMLDEPPSGGEDE